MVLEGAADRGRDVARLELIAEHGWRLLPRYRYSPGPGNWRHKGWEAPEVRRLTELQYRSGRLRFAQRVVTEPEDVLEEHLAEARALLLGEDRIDDLEPATVELSPHYEALRWFPLPREALEELTGSRDPKTDHLPPGWRT